jgi:hypothetical protein
MSDVIAPSNTVTFTVTRTPAREADRKTIQRLMRMQRPIQQGLRKLSRRRRREDNQMHPRAGRLWMSRVPATKLVRPEKGESFTLTLTPQLMNDVRAVEQYLDAKKAK